MDPDHTQSRPRFDLAELIRPELLVPGAPAPLERSFTWEQVQRVLQKNRRFALAFALMVTAVVTVAAFLMRDVYRPTARLEIDPPGTGINTLHEIEYSGQIDNQDYIETQAQILQSDALAIGVIRALGLDHNPELVSKKDMAKYGQPEGKGKLASAVSATDGSFLQEQFDLADRTPLESIALEVFQRKLSVSPLRNSRLIEVSYASHDPRLAQLVTNTLVTQYMDQNYRNRYTTTMEASAWLSTQLNDLREKVQQSNQAVADYQKKYGFVEADDRDVPLAQLMGEVNHQFSEASANRIEAEAYARMIDLGESDAIPAIRDDQLYQNLMTRFVDARAQLAQARTIYGDENSNVKKLNNEAKELAAQVESERTRMVNQVRTSYAAALEREHMLQQSREKLRAQMGDAGSHMVAYKVLKNEALATGELYDTLQARLKEAGIYAGLRSSNIHIVDLAPQLRRATAPNRALIIVIGAMAGCMLGLVCSFVRESVDNTLRSPDDIKEWIGLTSLAMLPRISANHASGYPNPQTFRSLSLSENGTAGKSTAPKIFSTRSHTAEAEAMRDLRTALLLSQAGAPPRVVLVSSPSSGEGKTTIAINLAIVLANRGSTCLIDGDLRRPMVADAFELRAKVGLSDVLAGRTPPQEALAKIPDVPGLSVLAGGHLPPNPSDLVASEHMEALMIALRDKFDHVVIDSPPAIPFSDARVLSPLCDVVVLVGRYGTTTRRALTRAAQLFSEVRASVIGVVLNDIDLTSADYRYFNYGSAPADYEFYNDAKREVNADRVDGAAAAPKKKGAHA
jgi:capsular exopolysaccharide synthesis family protein